MSDYKKYTNITLMGMKKANLVKYVRSLEDIIEKYDLELNKQCRLKKEAMLYIKECKCSGLMFTNVVYDNLLDLLKDY